MKFIADLHIHSKFSMATSKNLDFEHLFIAARLKGITVVGTGDFTHPGWIAEIRQKLEPAEQGLFKLRPNLAEICNGHIPSSCSGEVRFILVSEISNIYKKNGHTRKNHNLVFLPDLDSVDTFSRKLARIGNIQSDGRPILGLDAKHLLEILLETSDQGFLIPAHIWTPWFSLFGSKSGFDSIEACFEDLTPHIFAVETGLSSDPAMNWRVSALDGLTLVSNSDAHSPENIGREANLFDTDLCYSAIKTALATGDAEKFLGTFEFYPEEGKYHLDGHRKCQVRLSPQQTADLGGKCPVCGKSLTLGVLYRVEELADRPEGEKPEKVNPFYSILSLRTILSEIFKTGSKTKRVNQHYLSLLSKLGPEFDILHRLSADAIDRAGLSLLGEAIQRVRRKEIVIEAGYDGEFGKVILFKPGERKALMGQKNLFTVPDKKTKENLRPSVLMSVDNTEQPQTIISDKVTPPDKISRPVKPQKTGERKDLLSGLNKEQSQAVTSGQGPLLIVAGPGTGKTRTLTYRIAYLIKQKAVPAENILAVTFTNKAAQEMQDRLENLNFTQESVCQPFVATFHALCLHMLKNREGSAAFGIVDEQDQQHLVADAVAMSGRCGVLDHRQLLDGIRSAKQKLLSPDDNLDSVAAEYDLSAFADVYRKYQQLLSMQGLSDYEDLIFKVVRMLEADKGLRDSYQNRFKFIFVDEYQDLNQGQYRIIRALAPPGKSLCVIGDPDQSIYGFRGSDTKYFQRFVTDYPGAAIIHLRRNYRSTDTILEASYQIIRNRHGDGSGSRTYSGIDGNKTITLMECASDRAEAGAIGRMIEQMVGGAGYEAVNFGRVDSAHESKPRSFSDFAVLYRLNDQGRMISHIFDKSGIPYQMLSRQKAFSQTEAAFLISFLKVIQEVATFADLERIAGVFHAVLGKKSLQALKSWTFNNGFSLSTALLKARSFPIREMSRKAQHALIEMSNTLVELRKAMAPLSVSAKLACLAEKFIPKATQEMEPDVSQAINNLIFFSRSFGDRTSDFLASVALQSDTDTYDFKAEKVALMTMHAAKGLEFPIVFIAGCEQGFMPYVRSDTEIPDVNEERRLFYVAMTRAKEMLYLSHARKRRVYGRILQRTASPFIDEIEKRLIRKLPTLSFKKQGSLQVQLKLF